MWKLKRRRTLWWGFLVSQTDNIISLKCQIQHKESISHIYFLTNHPDTVSFTDRWPLCQEALSCCWWEWFVCVNGQAWTHDKGWIKLQIAQNQKSPYSSYWM